VKIRVVNPTRSRSAFRHRSKKQKSLSGRGGVIIVARKAKRRHRRLGNSHRRRHHNPFGFGRRHHRTHRRRRNPGGFSGEIRNIGGMLLWGTGGAVASLALPGMVASSFNSGWTGYALNGLTAWVGGMLVGKFAGPLAGAHFLAGGIIATGLRIFNNFFGSSFPIGLSGMGYYVQNNFPLPTAGTGPYLLNSGYESSVPVPSVGAAVPATPVAAASATGADEPARWASRWSG